MKESSADVNLLGYIKRGPIYQTGPQKRPFDLQNTLENLIAANANFYKALASGDGHLMRQIWSDAEDITCIHPGWGPVTGREAVMRSWETILESPPQINCTEPSGYISGESAYVIAFENLGEGRLIATNVFRLEFDNWKMIHHQAGIARPTPAPKNVDKTRMH